MKSRGRPDPALAGQEKLALRAQLRSRVSVFPKEARARASQQIVERILESRAFARAHTVLAYMPLPDEPDIRPVLERTLALGKVLVLPRTLPAAPGLMLHRVDNLQHLVQSNPELPRLFEPDPAKCEEIAASTIDLALIPGMGFIHRHALPHLWRLGRGKAHYDQLLAILPKRALRLGCFFACQEIQPPSALPLQNHDQPLDGVVTQEHVWGA